MSRFTKVLLAFVCAVLLATGASAQVPRYTGTGTITTNASIVTLPSHDYAIVTVTIHGTYAGVALVFEFSDDGGTTWYTDTCSRSDTPLLETGESVAANATLSWDCGIVATTNFRVRSTAYTSGTATINLTETQDQLEPAASTQVSPTASTPLILNAAGAATTVKATSGYIAGFSLLNNNAAVVYVEFFNTTSVTLGTTTPTAVFVIPASATLTVPPATFALLNGQNGLAVAAVTAYNGATPGSVTGTVLYF